MSRFSNLIFSIGLVFYSSQSLASNVWQKFLENAGQASYKELKNGIGPQARPCEKGDVCPTDLRACPVKILPTDSQKKNINELIVKGNAFAFEAALLIRRCLDGGDAEDFQRSSGMFFEKSPKRFLSAIVRKSVPDSQFESMIRMLPEDTVDHLDIQIKELKKRIDILKAKKNSSFQHLKKIGTGHLEKSIAELEKVQKEQR